ncbi:PE-PGRS family protein [Streptomyces himastatinicus ATCC 53653]|uniref:PE-PGRS family protein n=1 Tax=Streptomyces himastatinicus ATCC 53653 TaxID=457427 RepID=D9WTX0_9ACTN|nr:DUF6571 family protein [Streptomyces himastatinicus]EFL22218.1 PE-PGRS family protein [Streptomyces himastatinicus ATCC 53653]
MALTYQDVMTTDLSTLQSASEEWKAMGDKFKTLKTNYDTHVRGALGNGKWVGQGYNAAARSGGITAHELWGAMKEAHAVAEQLSEAHTVLTRLKSALKDLVKQAREDGYKVDSVTGQVTTDYDSKRFQDMTPEELRGYKNDPAGIAAREQQRTDLLMDQIKEIDEADFGYRTALERVTKDVDGKGVNGGFNSNASGDPEKYEGQRAEELAKKVADGDDLGDKEKRELRALLDGNEGDKAFSQTFVQGLGPEGTVKLGHELRGMGKDGDWLEKSVSTTIAAATNVPKDIEKLPVTSKRYQDWLNSDDGKFNKEFLAGLKKVGTENFASNTEPVYGYQEFVTLMKKGGKYDGSFLQTLGDDIMETEKDNKDRGLWDQWNGKPGQKGVEYDPLDGVLGLMSKDPDASTTYLDPKGSDRLQYLLKDRDWPGYLLNGGGAAPIDNKDLADLTNKVGFGQALEAAATGEVPGTKHPLGGHSEAEARVMQYAVSHLDDNMSPNLRPSMGHILTDYTPDTHEILSQANPAYESEKHIASGVFKDEQGNVRVALDPQVLDKVMRGVANDPGAFADMFNAERQYSADKLVQNPINGDTKAIDQRNNAIMGVGNVWGHYDGVMTDVALDKKDAAIQWARDVNHHVTAANAVVDFVPAKAPGVVAPGVDIVGRVVDFGMYDWTKEAVADATKVGGEEAAKTFNTGHKQMDALVVKWVEAQGGDPGIESGKPSPEIGVIQHEGQGTYSDGREQALINLGRPGG